MAQISIESYVSPTLCLLVLKWPEGFKRDDFLGFAIKRTPGFRDPKTGKIAPSSWLPNRTSFQGPEQTTTDGKKTSVDFPSNEEPIQKFFWWDARIDTPDRGHSFKYEVQAVTGKPGALTLDSESKNSISCAIPLEEVDGIGTYFNRAVVSSQAFTEKFGAAPTGKAYEEALQWLSNGMGAGIVNFIAGSSKLEMVAYHLTDKEWVIPALGKSAGGKIVYFDKAADHESVETKAIVPTLKKFVSVPRKHTSIMHDKYIVRMSGNTPTDVLTGTANFTTGGLTSQANVMHTIASPKLAKLYLDRAEVLAKDPSAGKITGLAKWSDPISVKSAKIRVIFSPEAGNKRVSLDTITASIKAAKSMVFFCLFDITDKDILDACFAAGDKGLLLRGLVNHLSAPHPKPDAKENAQTIAETRLYERSQKYDDVVGHASFQKGAVPNGFWWESSTLPVPGTNSGKGTAKNKGKKQGAPTVFVHHKFIVIDGGTANPIIYVGSQNLSNNSVHKNDENLLEIKGSTALSHAYIAEFLRLYEQYRARADYTKRLALQNDKNADESKTFVLKPDASWAANYYKSGTPEFRLVDALG